MQVIQSVSLPCLEQHVLRVVIFTRVGVTIRTPRCYSPCSHTHKYFIKTQINKPNELPQPQVVRTSPAVSFCDVIKTPQHA